MIAKLNSIPTERDSHAGRHGQNKMRNIFLILAEIILGIE